MRFLAFLTAAFFVSNAALLSADSDNSEGYLPLPGSLSNTNPDQKDLPLPGLLSNSNPGNEYLPVPGLFSNMNLDNKNLPLPGSLSSSNLGNEYLPPPDLVSLNPPAPSNEPINFDLNAIHSETPADQPTFSPETAQEASINGESSTVTPPITHSQTQTFMDDFNGMCIPDSSTGQKRRRGQSMCGNPAMLEFHQRVPKAPEAGRTRKQETNDDRAARDNAWIQRLFKRRLGAKWRQKKDQIVEYTDQLIKPREDACKKQSQEAGEYVRPYAFCCLGPSQDVMLPAKLRLARRQFIRVVTNWFNCDLTLPGRPSCDPPLSTSLCCVGYWDRPDPILNEPADLWRWGFKAADCVEAILG